MIDHQSRAMSGLSLARMEEIEAKLAAPMFDRLPMSSERPPPAWASEVKAGRKNRPLAPKHQPDKPGR
jgi:hypothetical protein